MLDEAINVGMVFLYPEHQRVITKFPKKFKGLECLYAGFDEGIVKQYFDLIQKKLQQFDGTEKGFTDKFASSSIREYIYNNIIIDDESSIQISEVKSAVLYSTNVDRVSQEIFNSYFNHYKSFELPVDLVEVKESIEVNPEVTMISEFERILVSHQVNVEKRFAKHVAYRSQSTNTEVVFDYVWNSKSSENLFKALNLNYSNKKRIHDRAIALHGSVHLLDMEKALPGNSKLNFVVSQPEPKHEKVFDSAIKILERSAYNTRVILEKDLHQYTEEVIQNL